MNGPIIITGFMGSGKTTVARSLAQAFNGQMIDLDQFIVERTGRTIEAIIDQDGEPAFREIESNLLAEVLTTNASRVIALGGGAWTIQRNRELIAERNGYTVWLNAPFELCWRRIVESGNERPLARKEGQARKLYEARRRFYEKATLRVDANEKASAAELAALILKAARAETIAQNQPQPGQ